MTQERRKDDRHPDRPLDWSDTETLAGQGWKAPAVPQAVAGKGEVPAGYVLLPEYPTNEMICAIENAIDSQLVASAMSPKDMFRQDGSTIYDALLVASPAAPSIPSPCAAEDSVRSLLEDLVRPYGVFDVALHACHKDNVQDFLDLLKRAKAVLSSPAERQEAEALRPTDDHLWDETIRDRDTYHDWADKLAEAISKHFGAYIGEHSNTNCSWAEALEAIEAASPASAETVQTVEDLQAALAMANARLAELTATPSSPSVSGTVDTPELKRLAYEWAARRAHYADDDNEHVCAAWSALVQHTAQAVRAAREEAAQWISVDERLPDDDCKVLAATWFTMDREQHLDIVSYRSGSGQFSHSDVTHWMPLPRTPQAAGTEQEKKQ